MLVEHLPPDGALKRAHSGHTWTVRDYLLANVVDAVQYGTHALTTVQGAKPKKPQLQPRPGDDERGSRTGRRSAGVTTVDVVTYLDSLKAG